MLRRLFSLIALLGALVVLSFPTTGAVSLGQQNTKRHGRRLTKSEWRNTPIKVTEAKLKRGVAEFGKVFTDTDDDWLEGLTINVKNTSNKTIVFIDFSLTLFDNNEGLIPSRPPVGFPFSYGSDSGKARPVQPGESVDVTLSMEELDILKAFLLNYDYPISFRNADVRLDRVVFADGQVWYKGQFFYRDPKNPNRFNATRFHDWTDRRSVDWRRENPEEVG